MRKIIVALFAVLTLSGCANEYEKKEKAELQKEIAELKAEKVALSKEVAGTKIEKGTAKYILTIEIKQKHFMDLGKAIKNNMNAIELQIPVDKEYYDSLEVGDVLDDSFRVGSLLLEGSYGSWNIKVKDKEIK